jgi:hypothetical protein
MTNIPNTPLLSHRRSSAFPCAFGSTNVLVAINATVLGVAVVVDVFAFQRAKWLDIRFIATNDADACRFTNDDIRRHTGE